MNQDTLRDVFIVIYMCSSYVGMVLYFFMWWLTRADRVGLKREELSLSRAQMRQTRTVAYRNEILAGLLALAFIFYTVISTIAVVRLFGLLSLPWVEGFVTVPLLVLGNVLEMLIAVLLVRSRRLLNHMRRDGE